MTSFLVFKKVAFKVITVFILVFSRAMLQAVLKFALEKKLSISKEFTRTMKEVILPLPFITKRTVEIVSSISSSKPISKDPFIYISILIKSFASAMGLCSLPLTFVFYNIILLFSFVMQFTDPMELSIQKFTFVYRAIPELIDPMSAHKISLPITTKFIAISPRINSISLFLLWFTFKPSLVMISVCQIALDYDFFSHYSNFVISCYQNQQKMAQNLHCFFDLSLKSKYFWQETLNGNHHIQTIPRYYLC